MKILYLPATLLFVAIFGMPNDYYTFLRLAITGMSLYAAFGLLEKGSVNFWVMLFIALLFNPFFPVHLSKEIWILINIIFGSYFTSTAYRNSK